MISNSNIFSPLLTINRGNNVQAQARGRARNRGPGNQAGQAAGRGRSRTKRGPNNNRGILREPVMGI